MKMAIEKIGDDERVRRTVTCKHCGSILQYLPCDIQERRVTHQSDVDTEYHIPCPTCKQCVPVKP